LELGKVRKVFFFSKWLYFTVIHISCQFCFETFFVENTYKFCYEKKICKKLLPIFLQNILYKTLFATNFVRNTCKFYNFVGNNYPRRNYLPIKFLRKNSRKKSFLANFFNKFTRKFPCNMRICSSVILPQSRFSPNFSQPPHTVNILYNDKKKRREVSGSHDLLSSSLEFFYLFSTSLKRDFFHTTQKKTFLLYPLSSSSQGQKYLYWISLSSPSINDHSRITHIKGSYTSIPNTKIKHLKNTSRGKATKT